MAKYEYTGEVTEILPVRTYGQKSIQVREFRCKEPPPPNGRWENVLPFCISYDPTGDKYNNISQLDDICVGDTVKFSFTMRGREWTNPKDNTKRIFVDNKVCSKIVVIAHAQPPAVSAPPETLAAATAHERVTYGDDAGDMPF